MDASPTSTPSSESPGQSTRSGHMPGTPKPPIDPPRRRSSLAFSQALPQPSPTSETTADDAGTNAKAASTPMRSLSNIGRKRAHASPFVRSVATPGHVAQMQKIFSNAKASLQLDMRYAASPEGSIGSRLPFKKEKETPTVMSNCDPHKYLSMNNKTNDWRYSTVPFTLTNKDMDVREPFPEETPLLPNLSYGEPDQTKAFVAEPMSSGFTSPVGHGIGAVPMEGDALLSTLPGPNHTESKSRSPPDDEPGSEYDTSLPRFLLSTELEGPLTDLHFNRDDTAGDDTDEIDDSPIVSHLKRLSGGTKGIRHLSGELDNEIFLSTQAKAAAESAKAKRGILKNEIRSSSNKENIEPTTEESDPTSSGSPLTYPCPNPSVHIGEPASLCPEPALHYRTNTPSLLGPPSAQGTPSPNVFGYCPSPSLRASLQSGVPHLHRVDCTGSPMPILRSPPPVQGRTFYSRSSYYPSPPRPPNRSANLRNRPSYRSNYVPSVADHFQPGWYYSDPPPQPSDKAASLTYAFSTAAAKEVGSSPAPDSRIRDSYRTDTLTPLARPVSRFRKNGIGAMTRGNSLSNYYSNAGGEHSHEMEPLNGLRHSGVRRRSEPPQVMPSPPRPVINSSRFGPQKRGVGRPIERGNFEIIEDDTAESQVAILEEDEEPMEVDDDISAAVQMSVLDSERMTKGNNSEEGAANGVNQRPKSLSPKVTPYRKGVGPRRKRRPSYWDEDLPEVAKSPARHMRKKGEGREICSSPAKSRTTRVVHGKVGRGSLRPQVSFNVDDLSGELKKAGEILERRLSAGVDIGTGPEDREETVVERESLGEEMVKEE